MLSKQKDDWKYHQVHAFKFQMFSSVHEVLNYVAKGLKTYCHVFLWRTCMWAALNHSHLCQRLAYLQYMCLPPYSINRKACCRRVPHHLTDEHKKRHTWGHTWWLFSCTKSMVKHSQTWTLCCREQGWIGCCGSFPTLQSKRSSRLHILQETWWLLFSGMCTEICWLILPLLVQQYMQMLMRRLKRDFRRLFGKRDQDVDQRSSYAW